MIMLEMRPSSSRQQNNNLFRRRVVHSTVAWHKLEFFFLKYLSVECWEDEKKTREVVQTLHLTRKSNQKVKDCMLSEVGFEPTPTKVDCDLNAAP